MDVGFVFISVLSVRTVVWNVLKWHLWAYCSLAVNATTACPSKTNTFIRPFSITCVPQEYKTLVNLRKDVLLYYGKEMIVIQRQTSQVWLGQKQNIANLK